ncbi:hypothetical protein LTR56_015056 [Elasticomyces elasticus]|nr:hypothetical protein LTR56_015056 [Elasticomyces elasticus]KAK3639278.1 hypothetical protein LTR22_017479 [Elasticomyces elasticus]KAK4915691.1 hypothetical protein LTR49_016175 [Elasticomyces elasticus]KAK5746278.1 hypothetical protein LTS12_022801 [Elasticomyces elasticus]
MAPMDDFARNVHDAFVTVKVGSNDDIRDFKLPRALLRARVEWFDSALQNGRFLESTTGIITLPEDDPEIFVATLYYIYHQTLSFQPIAERDEN